MRKKYIILLCAVCVMFVFSPSKASADSSPYGPEGRRFGAGIIVGDPTGLTLKGYLTSRIALGAIAAWSFVNDSFTAIGDVTYDILDIPTSVSTVTFPVYVGVGGKVGIRGKKDNQRKTIVGIRVPLGIAAQWTNHPAEVYVEVAPGIEVIPGVEFDITGGIGARYYFF